MGNLSSSEKLLLQFYPKDVLKGPMLMPGLCNDSIIPSAWLSDGYAAKSDRF